MKGTQRVTTAMLVFLAATFGHALLVSAASVPYRIGEGDVLEINVWKKPELSHRVVVRPDGMITLPLIQEIKAAGLTAAELRQSIADQITAYVNAPDISVTVEEARSYRAFILGAVGANGSFPLTGSLTAAQLLAQAGGPTAEADLARAYIARGDQKIALNLLPGAGSGEAGPSPAILPGDTLTVPFNRPYQNRILVVGEVTTPKAIPFKEGMTILDAYLETGGGTANADPANIGVFRKGNSTGKERISVDLRAVLTGKSMGWNIPLESGDIVTVPAREGSIHPVLVLGQVKNPKSIPYREGMTVLDAYADAGGGTEWADEGSVKVVRRKSGGGKEEINVDLKRIMKKGDISLNIPLIAGDIIFVPQ